MHQSANWKGDQVFTLRNESSSLFWCEKIDIIPLYANLVTQSDLKFDESRFEFGGRDQINSPVC